MGRATISFPGLAAAGLLGAVAVCVRAQPCGPYWAWPATPSGDPAVYGGRAAVFGDGLNTALYSTYASVPLHVGVARWRGLGWEQINNGLPAPLTGVSDLLVLDDGAGPRLYVFGAGNPSVVDRLWVWNGASWQPTPPGFGYFDQSTGHYAQPFCSFNDGFGMRVYGVAWIAPFARFARWDGQNWLPVTPMGVGDPFQMRAFDLGDGSAIYLSGFSAMPDLPSAHGIAKWDGHQLSALGSGFTGISADTRSLAVFDAGQGPELYVAGGHTEVGGVPGTSGLAKWNGQRWAAVPGHSGDGVLSLAVFDNGTGPALYATGAFTVQGGIPCRHIARFDGANWSPLGDGVPSNSNYLTPFPPDPRGPSLFVWASAGSGGVGGGGLYQSGDYQWIGCPNCYANCDNSTRAPTLNVLDFMCFLNKFAARDPYANCTVDATIDLSDFICFMNKFAAGCP